MEKETATSGERTHGGRKPLVTLSLLDAPILEKESEEDKSKAIDESSFDEEEYDAALCLFSLKDAKIDEEDAARLEDMKRNTLSRRINGKDVQEEAPKIVFGSKRKNMQEEAPKSSPRINCKKVKEEAPRIQAVLPWLILNDYVPPDIPPIAAIQSIIGQCSRPSGKVLTVTDLTDHQTRLSLTKNEVQESFLPLLKEGENVSSGIEVITYDKDGKEYPMMFKCWTSKMYVLTGKGWKIFYKEHGLRPGKDEVTVWMFRHKITQKLCFAITEREREI